MTRYTVVWHRLCEDELVELWISDDNRSALAAAVDRIDSELAIDPSSKGSRVSDRSRELTVGSVQVLFRVREDDRVVEVFSVAKV